MSPNLTRRGLLKATTMLGIGGVLVGCSRNTSSSGSASAGAKYRVAYIARAQSDSFAAWLANEMKNAAGQFPDLSLEVFDGQANDDTENTLIENAITNRFNAIIVQPNNGEAQRPYVEKVVAANIIAITTNARIANIPGASSVDANPYDQGAGVAKKALADVPKGGKVVVLNGPAGNFHAIERRKAWQAEFFDKRPDVKIVGEQIANWNKDEGMKLMEDWMTANPQIDAICSMNDNMCAGALEAVGNKPSMGKLFAYGTDGTPEACLLIQSGKMSATTLQSAIDLAKLNIQSVHDLLTGAQKQIDKNIDAPVVDSSNVAQYIDMYKKSNLIK